MRIIAAVVLSLAIVGCASIAPEQIANADYGPRPDNYQEVVKSFFAQKLFDPYSAVYTFEEPRKGFTHRPTARFGWAVCGTVNAKIDLEDMSGLALFLS